MGRGGLWGAGGRLFEAGRLLTFPASRMGAYSRWALIRVWALIRINITLFRLARKSKQSGIFGRVLYGYQGVIAKIRQFCNRFEILISTQLILKMRQSLQGRI